MKQHYTTSEIHDRFAKIVADSLRIDTEKVTMDATLDELGAESLDLIEITMATEDAFDVWISEKSILDTAKEVFGEGVLEQDGVLTDEGKALLRERMPDLDPAMLEGQITIQDLTKQFLKVSVWVRMIEGLLEFAPAACPSCGGALGRAVAFRKKCEKCGTETMLTSGEELNRKWVTEYRDRVVGAQR